MKGAGRWYVTRKGKLCLELTARGVDENWCRHVFRAGESYYLSKDLRPSGSPTASRWSAEPDPALAAGVESHPSQVQPSRIRSWNRTRWCR